MNTPPRPRAILALVLTASLGLLGACGGDDDGSSGVGDTGDTADGGELPELPPELQAELRPVEVSGAALPRLTSSDDDAIPDDPAVGSPAPVLVGQDFDDATVRIDAAQDGPTMVVFLAHWCPHCNNEIPVLNEWRDSGQIPADLRIVGVSTAVSDQRPNYPPSEWLVEKDWQWDVIADSPDQRAMDAYGVTGFPFFTLLDADGNVVQRGSGEIPLEGLNQLAALVAG